MAPPCGCYRKFPLQFKARSVQLLDQYFNQATGEEAASTVQQMEPWGKTARDTENYSKLMHILSSIILQDFLY